MGRFALFLSLAFAGALGAFTQSAQAEPSAVTTFTIDGSFVASGFCSFDVTWSFHADVRQTTFFDGSFTRFFMESDTFTGASGKTLSGEESYTQHFAADGTEAVTGTFFVHILLPDGGIFLLTAGRGVLDPNRQPIFDAGLQTSNGLPGDSAAFCAALN